MKVKAIEDFFRLDEFGTTVGRELCAGLVTFMTMSYIIFLQPQILSSCGMDFGAVMLGLCVASAFASILMGLLANYPIALAPGMGENFFFLTVTAACVSLNIQTAWQTALGVVFVSGLVFLLITIFNVRLMIMNSISTSLQYAIACGIGMFIALLGLKQGGIVVFNKAGSGLSLNMALGNATALIFLVGLMSTVAMQALRARGAILYGILVGALIAAVAGKLSWGSHPSMPSLEPVLLKMDLASVWRNLTALLPFIIIFTFMDVFDNIGTLLGVSAQAGLLKDGRLPGANRALTADSMGTVVGAAFGNSTVTSYIESAVGVEYGGRTGLVAVSTGLCFLLSVFLYPIVAVVGNYPGGVNPITAPALVIVGAMMMRNAGKIAWDDHTEAIPAFLIMAGIPFTSSIADGLALGFITYPILKLLSGRIKEAGWITYVMGVVLLLYLLTARTAAN